MFNGCASVPDVPVCVKLTERAWCTYTISDKEFYWDEENKFEGKTFWEASPSLILVPPSSWAKIKSYIIQQCKVNENCSKDITSWERKLDKVDKKIQVGKE